MRLSCSIGKVLDKVAYNNPSSHERRISNNLQKIAKKMEKMFLKETGGSVDFILVVNSKAARVAQAGGGGQPAGMYVASMDRTSSALSMAEMLAKWQIMGQIAPLNELEDASGNKLSDIMKAFTPETGVDDMGETH